MNTQDVGDYLSGLRTLLTDTDSPEKFVDAPIALQLAGTRYEDEELVAALGVIDEILKA
jgi:Asp-tRNA(Asn)/Glu-tRNA(Gln) amidotransferase A subunit family amidase